ncbi:hypothetical protein V1289_000783 [Bradyrhizobium sp. AZCC 2289]
MNSPTDAILRSLPPGPREARPDDRLRKRLEGWTQHTDSRPSFETRGEDAAPQVEVRDSFTASQDNGCADWML